jgi:transcriptional regulator with XRE-family HTH domain
MAKRAGLAEGTLSEIENGLTQPKPEQLIAVQGAAMDELADILERFAILVRYLRRSRCV